MFRTSLLSVVSVLAVLSTAPAMADTLDFAGSLTGKYSNVNPSGNDSVNQWNLDTQAIFSLDDFGLGNGFSVQIDAGFIRSHTRNWDTDTWNLGGSAVYSEDFGRVGATFGWNEVSEQWMSIGHYNYGLFGEWFVNDYFTAGVKGGFFSGDFDGHYVGLNLTGYALENLAISGAVSHAQINRVVHETVYNLQGEYLVSDDLPISFFAGYSYSQYTNGASNNNIFFLGLRFFTNSNATTLIEHHRTGTVSGLTGYNSNIVYQ